MKMRKANDATFVAANNLKELFETFMKYEKERGLHVSMYRSGDLYIMQLQRYKFYSLVSEKTPIKGLSAREGEDKYFYTATAKEIAQEACIEFESGFFYFVDRKENKLIKKKAPYLGSFCVSDIKMPMNNEFLATKENIHNRKLGLFVSKIKSLEKMSKAPFF